jgi:hypothetical protein
VVDFALKIIFASFCAATQNLVIAGVSDRVAVAPDDGSRFLSVFLDSALARVTRAAADLQLIEHFIPLVPKCQRESLPAALIGLQLNENGENGVMVFVRGNAQYFFVLFDAQDPEPVQTFAVSTADFPVTPGGFVPLCFRGPPDLAGVPDSSAVRALLSASTLFARRRGCARTWRSATARRRTRSCRCSGARWRRSPRTASEPGAS